VDVAPPDLLEVEGGFIHVEYDDLFYDVPGGMPDDGSFFAHMKPDGDLSFTRLSQEFDALPGDEIKGAAFFFDGEFNVDFPDIPQDCFYADGMAVEIMAPGSVLVKRVYFAKHCPGTPYIPSEPSGFPIVDGSTPWTAWSYTFDGTEDMGPYTVRAQISNIGDNIFDSTSGLDGVELVLAPDSDGDGIPDYADNCLGDSNPTQANSDMDAFGDACP
jgi:hypothetical protein